MPGTFILRYLLPENNAPMIFRRKIIGTKDLMIKRAIFNGTGIVIWQDIFGAWLPYSSEQKQQLRKWKTVFLENHDIYIGADPVSLSPSAHPKIYVNRFASEAHCIYSIYNASDAIVSDIFLESDTKLEQVQELWRQADISTDDRNILGEIHPGEVMIVRRFIAGCTP